LKHIYLSPHLDDAVYSCGGKIAQDVQHGDSAAIWTIFAGDPTSELTPFARELHARWGIGVEAVAKRRAEDTAACRKLGAESRHLSYPDCIYRIIPESGEPVITMNEDLFTAAPGREEGLVRQIRNELLRLNPQQLPMACPLGIGLHLDHRIVREAAERTGLPLIYYADFPYAADPAVRWADFVPPLSTAEAYAIDDKSLELWTDAVAAYTSQVSTFWSSIDEMHRSIRSYSGSIPGHTLWKGSSAREVR